MPVQNLNTVFDRVPPAKEVRELLTDRMRDVQKLRALLKLAEVKERLSPAGKEATNVA